MFNWLFPSKNPKQEELKEFSFIWYKKLETPNRRIYTQPFRTKVRAKSYEEAKQKVVDFALGKMQLVVVPEENFKDTDLSKFERKFYAIYTEMDEMFGWINKTLKNK